ncbi:hypothetical protein QE152_g34100 [Popillia japonica]|uniref:Uncharacterized protein n=1 Tax=Popillia japonica TaxID=7064 RepID=A0AAW1IU81_POPJA
MHLKPFPKTTDTAWGVNSNCIESEQYFPKTTDTAWGVNSNCIESEQYELQEEMDNLSDITEEGGGDLDPNFNSDNSEFGEKSGSSSDNSDAEIIQAEG